MPRTTFLPKLDAPVPTIAGWNPVGPTLTMTFSIPIEDAQLETPNWVVRHNNINFTVFSAEATGGRILLGLISGLPSIGPDVVSYSPPPHDVVSAVGHVPAPAFADFPIT